MKLKTPPRKNSRVSTTSPNAEWVDAKQAFAIFKLGRTTMDRLRKEGKIKSVSLREPGMARGKRLYEIYSVRGYLESLATV